MGLHRGASKDKVYNGTRLLSANLTRLWEDAHSIAEWRDKGFYPVLADAPALSAGKPTEPGKPSEQGTVQGMLALKTEYPLPTSGTLPDSFDFNLDRDASCPKPEEFEEYRRERPYQGMPFGFPGLDADRLATLTTWLENGAQGVQPAARPAAEAQALADWEAFFNGDDNRRRLMSRYIFEHLFIGDLYFSDVGGAPSDVSRGWYKLVRSRTPPGKPIDLIATRRPYDSPGTDTFYYRLQLRSLSRLAKRHMPYALNRQRMQRWTDLFLEPEYSVATLPAYSGKNAANPFVTFEQLPVNARYRFMLDEAHFTIMAYIKGPVCRGQVALNVIDDHFWVAFVEPSAIDPNQNARFLAAEAKDMRLPQAKGSLVVTALQWRGYAKGQQRYLRAQAKAIARVIDSGRLGLNMDFIWDGGPDHNPNAALTIFRHFDSATVVKGLVGQQPETMWVIDYSLLERIHYLLVAGFDVYGAVGHQLESRLYMDFLRMEGEQAFLKFIPAKNRIALRNHWYRDAKDDVRDYVLSPDNAKFERDSAIEYHTSDSKAELMALFKAHIPAAQRDRYSVDEPSLERLMRQPSAAFRYLPEVSFLQVLARDGGREVYTLILNRAHSNNAQLFAEEDRLIPEENTVTVAKGFIGAYPNMFFQLTEKQLESFVVEITAMRSDEDYTRLVERYGVRRTAPWFWKLSDEFHAVYRARHPIEAGVFDLNRYQNR